MKGLNRVKRFLSPTEDGEPIEKPQPNLVQQILDAPAEFNRATRRAIGLYGRFWKWDMRGTEMQRTFVPRYIRRHSEVLKIVTRKRTRRERRHVARIHRIAITRGM